MGLPDNNTVLQGPSVIPVQWKVHVCSTYSPCHTLPLPEAGRVSSIQLSKPPEVITVHDPAHKLQGVRQGQSELDGNKWRSWCSGDWDDTKVSRVEVEGQRASQGLVTSRTPSWRGMVRWRHGRMFGSGRWSVSGNSKPAKPTLAIMAPNTTKGTV